MNKQQDITGAIFSRGLLPLYFHPSTEVSADVLKALYDAGIRAVEYTNRGGEALDVFTALKKFSDSELAGMYLGIGTIKNTAAAESFIAAGADFIISPGLSREVFRVSAFHQTLYIPGCMTPSEIMEAEEMGAGIIKLFPGNVLGPSYMAAIKDLFPRMLFMPTGGVEVSHENIHGWFAAGVSAVGMGSRLLPKEVMEKKDYAAITSLTADVLQTIARVRETLANKGHL